MTVASGVAPPPPGSLAHPVPCAGDVSPAICVRSCIPSAPPGFLGLVAALGVHFIRLNENYFSVYRISINIPGVPLSLDQVIGFQTMSIQQIVALKLQMGIDPLANVHPSVLLAMWQQLNLECKRKLRNQSRAESVLYPMTLTPIDV